MSRRVETQRDISKYEGTIYLNPPQGEEKFIVGKTLYQDLTPDLFAKSQIKMTQRPHKKLPMPEDLIDLPKFRRNNPYDYKNQKDYIENEKSRKMRRRWKISNEDESRSFIGSWQSSKQNQVMLCIDKGVCVARFLDDWYEFKPIPNIHRDVTGDSLVEQIIDKEDETERKRKVSMKDGDDSSDYEVKKESGPVNVKKMLDKFSRVEASKAKDEDQYSGGEDNGLDFTENFDDDEVDEPDQEKSPVGSDEDEEKKISSENDSDEEGDEEGATEGGEVKSEAQQAQLAQDSGEDSGDDKASSSASRKSSQKKVKSESIGSPTSASSQDRKRKSEADASAATQSTREGFVTSYEVKDYMMQFGGTVESKRLLAFFKPRLNTNESVEWFKKVVGDVCDNDADKYVLRTGRTVAKKGRR